MVQSAYARENQNSILCSQLLSDVAIARYKLGENARKAKAANQYHTLLDAAADMEYQTSVHECHAELVHLQDRLQQPNRQASSVLCDHLRVIVQKKEDQDLAHWRSIAHQSSEAFRRQSDELEKAKAEVAEKDNALRAVQLDRSQVKRKAKRSQWLVADLQKELAAIRSTLRDPEHRVPNDNGLIVELQHKIKALESQVNDVGLKPETMTQSTTAQLKESTALLMQGALFLHALHIITRQARERAEVIIWQKRALCVTTPSPSAFNKKWP